MGVKVITPAAQQIPTADLRAHCRIDGTDEDALLAGYLAAAVGYAEHYTQRSIGEQTLELALDAFPACGAIDLPRGPVASIESIKYLDAAGVEQTLSDTQYSLDDYGLVPRVILVADAWPATDAVANAVKVRYEAGSLPDAVKTALLLTVGHLFENREATAPDNLAELPLGVDCMLDTVKVWGM